jgi:hypothetical protein
MKYIFVLLFVISACKEKVPAQDKKDGTGPYAASVFMNADSSFGYGIYQDSVMVIRQSNIPAMPGNRGFEDRAQAGRIADFVVFKLNAGSFPPTLTTLEIDSVLKIK